MPTTPLKKTFECYTSFALGAALVFGGLMGSMKGSLMSLIMGSGSGILLLVAAVYTRRGFGEPILFSACLTFILSVAMTIRYFMTGAPLSGYVAILCGIKFAIDFVWLVRSVLNIKFN
jgi:uncharacterized membrane protein (UPF0136 family)